MSLFQEHHKWMQMQFDRAVEILIEEDVVDCWWIEDNEDIIDHMWQCGFSAGIKHGRELERQNQSKAQQYSECLEQLPHSTNFCGRNARAGIATDE